MPAGRGRPITTQKSAEFDCFCGWEQIIDIDRALVHPQPELLDAVRGARTEETTTMKVVIPYHLQFGSHGLKTTFWFSVKKKFGLVK